MRRQGGSIAQGFEHWYRGKLQDRRKQAKEKAREIFNDIDKDRSGTLDKVGITTGQPIPLGSGSHDSVVLLIPAVLTADYTGFFRARCRSSAR